MKQTAAIVSILLCAFSADSARACLCTNPDVADAIGYQDFAFIGTAESSGERIEVWDDINDYEQGYQQVIYSVSRVFKGCVGSRFKMMLDISSCGWAAQPGLEVLVFAQSGTTSSAPLTFLCSGNRSVSSLTNDERVSLGVGQPTNDGEVCVTPPQPIEPEDGDPGVQSDAEPEEHQRYRGCSGVTCTQRGLPIPQLALIFLAAIGLFRVRRQR